MKKIIKQYTLLLSILYTIISTTLSLPCLGMEAGAQEDFMQQQYIASLQHEKTASYTHRTIPRTSTEPAVSAAPSAPSRHRSLSTSEIPSTTRNSEKTLTETQQHNTFDTLIARFILAFQKDPANELTQEAFRAVFNFNEQNPALYVSLIKVDQQTQEAQTPIALPQNPLELIEQLNLKIKQSVDHKKEYKKSSKKHKQLKQKDELEEDQENIHPENPLLIRAIEQEFPLTFSAILTTSRKKDQYTLQDTCIDSLIKHETSYITTQILSQPKKFLVTDTQKIKLLLSNKIAHNTELFKSIYESIIIENLTLENIQKISSNLITLHAYDTLFDTIDNASQKYAQLNANVTRDAPKTIANILTTGVFISSILKKLVIKNAPQKYINKILTMLNDKNDILVTSLHIERESNADRETIKIKKINQKIANMIIDFFINETTSFFTIMLIRQKNLQFIHDYCLKDIQRINNEDCRSFIWLLKNQLACQQPNQPQKDFFDTFYTTISTHKIAQTFNLLLFSFHKTCIKNLVQLDSSSSKMDRLIHSHFFQLLLLHIYQLPPDWTANISTIPVPEPYRENFNKLIENIRQLQIKLQYCFDGSVDNYTEQKDGIKSLLIHMLKQYHKTFFGEPCDKFYESNPDIENSLQFIVNIPSLRSKYLLYTIDTDTPDIEDHINTSVKSPEEKIKETFTHIQQELLSQNQQQEQERKNTPNNRHQKIPQRKPLPKDEDDGDDDDKSPEITSNSTDTFTEQIPTDAPTIPSLTTKFCTQPQKHTDRFIIPVYNKQGQSVAIIRLLKRTNYEQEPIMLPNKKLSVIRIDYNRDPINEIFAHHFPQSIDYRITTYGIQGSSNNPAFNNIRFFAIPAQIFFKDHIYGGYFEYAINQHNQCFHRFFRGYIIDPEIFAHDIDITPEHIQTLANDQLNLHPETIARARIKYRQERALLEHTFTA